MLKHLAYIWESREEEEDWEGGDIHAYMDMIMSMLTLSCSRDMHPLPREEENLHICGKVLKW